MNAVWCGVVASLAAALVVQYAVYACYRWSFEAVEVIPPHVVRRMVLLAAVPVCVLLVATPYTVYHTESRAAGPLAAAFFVLELVFLPSSHFSSVHAVAIVLVAAAATFTAFVAVAATENRAMLGLHCVPLANVWLNDCLYYVRSYAHYKRATLVHEHSRPLHDGS
jgi:hypothetical protein